MKKIDLKNGKVIKQFENGEKCEDYIEVELEDKRVVIITASPGGKLKMGLKILTKSTGQCY